MSPALIYALLALALLLPLAAAAALRILGGRLSDAQVAGVAALALAIAGGSTFALTRSNVESLRVGDLTLLMMMEPAAAPVADLPLADDAAPSPAPPTEPTEPAPTSGATPTLTVTLTLTASPSVEPTATITPTIEPTATITPTLEPTATLTPTATLAPTEPPAPAPAQPRTYTVQPGDTIRGIAEQFNVTVAALLSANNLAPEQADSIRPGQVLTIPPS